MCLTFIFSFLFLSDGQKDTEKVGTDLGLAYSESQAVCEGEAVVHVNKTGASNWEGNEMNDLNKKNQYSGVIKDFSASIFFYYVFLYLFWILGFFFFSLVIGIENIFPSLWLVLFALIN